MLLNQGGAGTNVTAVPLFSRLSDKQAHVDLQHDPDGWVQYAIRSRSKVRLIVGDRQTHAIANGLIGDARRLYEDLRKQVMADRRPRPTIPLAGRPTPF